MDQLRAARGMVMGVVLAAVFWLVILAAVGVLR